MNVDQIIDKRTVAIPGPIGQVTPSMQQLHDEARTYAANTKALQDDAVTGLLTDTTSTTRATLDQWLGGTMAWFGDSWSDANQPTNSQNAFIPKTVSKAMGCTLYNYAVGGSGFVTGATFRAQIANAVANTRLDRDSVRYAIIFGGINDRNAAPDDTVINATMSDLESAFPKAKLICIPMQHAWNANDWGNTLGWLVGINRNAHPQVAIANGAAFWAINDTKSFNNTNPGHPNGTGVKVFASKIISALASGSANANLSSFNATLSDGVTGTFKMVNSPRPRYFTVTGYLKSTSSGNVTIGVLKGRVLYGPVFIAPDVCVDAPAGTPQTMFINFTTASTDPAIADYIGPQTTLIAKNMVAGVSYYFNREYPYL